MKGEGTKMTAVSLNFRTITDTVTYTIGTAKKGNRRYLKEQWEFSTINARHQITDPGNSEH